MTTTDDHDVEFEDDVMKGTSRKGGSPVRKRRVLFIIAAVVLGLILAVVVIEVGLRIHRAWGHYQALRQPMENDCEALVILTMGDSMTWGLMADHETESYPSRLPVHMAALVPNVPITTFNIGVPGSNTSEGLNLLEEFYQYHAEDRVDYAFILYGMNNRWNLHDATFWEWDPRAKDENYTEYIAQKLQLDKAFRIGRFNREQNIRDITDHTYATEFQSKLRHHGWNLFFKQYDDELLSEWIARDTEVLVERLRSRGVRPWVLTYHFNVFPYLNDVIRRGARQRELPLLDIEKEARYWRRGKLLSIDRMHPNARGYDEMSRIIAEEFVKTVGAETIRARWKSKKIDCDAGHTPLK